MKSIDQLLRPNIKALKPYSSARDEFSGEEAIFLDANENPFNPPYNRYPDPYQRKLKEQIARIKNIPSDYIFLGNGSDEAIDIAYRAFCEPGIDNVVAIDPTYGMYLVAADINNIETRKVKLTEDFELKVDAILDATDENTKLLFICSPNNPTGNSFKAEDIITIIENFEGIVVLDEAYIDFVPEKSFIPKLKKYTNLIILQTFSKAWGMAGIRLGMAFASPEIIRIFNKIKYPYNVNILTQKTALDLLQNEDDMAQWVKEIIEAKSIMKDKLKEYSFIHKIYPSDANYLLVKTDNAKGIYNYLVEQGVVIRDRSSVALCEGCLRITIGSTEENNGLYTGLDKYSKTINC
ncbi:histidinol-phosphate transaminase [Plebeiibacterium sediminum]|uniref:Histidinol-phosphate aminotransferase n=1 Tax=Plebeiibacterium sediminum TaxID=2992112 RepID=A0AAE3M1C3_9BACT|nr:histidinol-phosphate transaminase [Plebeiobacterium sediminum]MCW3785037.1 histidinol-phosphate transaminase [Plebeiobacterium sediminum]